MTEIIRVRKYETRTFYPDAKYNAKYSMAVRAGNLVFLRGQTGFDLDGRFHGVGDVTIQADNACKCVKTLLEELLSRRVSCHTQDMACLPTS